MYTPTTLASAWEFWTLRYDSVLDDGIFVVHWIKLVVNFLSSRKIQRFCSIFIFILLILCFSFGWLVLHLFYIFSKFSFPNCFIHTSKVFLLITLLTNSVKHPKYFYGMEEILKWNSSRSQYACCVTLCLIRNATKWIFDSTMWRWRFFLLYFLPYGFEGMDQFLSPQTSSKIYYILFSRYQAHYSFFSWNHAVVECS